MSHGADEASDRRWSKVRLADVNAARCRQPRDVGTIVDDERRLSVPRDRRDGGRLGQQARARHRFAAKLQEGGAAVEKCAREIERPPPRALGGFDVDDRV